MAGQENDRHSDQVEHGENSELNVCGNGHGQRIISYNLKEEERPGELKIRFKVRIVGGKTAAAIDARQAEAIREFLTWVAQQERQPPSPPSP
jgi:hypothetical protein